MADISLKFVDRQGFDSGRHSQSSLVLLCSIVLAVFINLILGRCVWEGSPHTRFQVTASDRKLWRCFRRKEQGT